MDVVAAAIVRDGLLLAARRSRPERCAGAWEFPGGKVEPGEDEPAALMRECREELGVDVRVGRRLTEATDGDLRLVLYAATILDGDPEPLEDHDELRWLAAGEIGTVRWLPIDLLLLDGAAGFLRQRIRTRPR